MNNPPQAWYPNRDWRHDAKCAGEEFAVEMEVVDEEETKTETFDIYYPPRDKKLYKDLADRAKLICTGDENTPPCPVRKDCLYEAVKTEEPHGIWGGYSHRERNALVRRIERRGMTVKDYFTQGKPLWKEKKRVSKS